MRSHQRSSAASGIAIVRRELVSQIAEPFHLNTPLPDLPSLPFVNCFAAFRLFRGSLAGSEMKLT
jgi:hypothetical protein